MPAYTFRAEIRFGMRLDADPWKNFVHDDLPTLDNEDARLSVGTALLDRESDSTFVVDAQKAHETPLPELIAAMTPDGLTIDPLERMVATHQAPDSRCGFIPGYSLIGHLGRGGMSVVYQAIQEKLQRVVALKVLTPRRCVDPASVKLFEQEAMAVAKLNHPNIVTAFDYGEAEGRFYLALEYIEGLNCLELIEREGKIATDRALEIVRGAVLGLSHALSHGIIHRDVKPANLMFAEDGHRDASGDDVGVHVKVTDLGLAQMEENAHGGASSGTKKSCIAGTPAYMAPEQARGETVDFRADIYALGASLYHMLTGRQPYSADTIRELLRRKLTERLTHPQDIVETISTPVCWLLERMMARSSENRYAGYEDLLADIDLIRAGRVPIIDTVPPTDSSFLPPVNPHETARRRRSDFGPIDVSPSRRLHLAMALAAPALVALGFALGRLIP